MGKNDDRFSILSVGRFVPLKGFDLTIRSFAAFYKSLCKEKQALTNLLIIGTGPEKKRLQEIIAAEGLEHAIEIKEWMPRSEVIEKFSCYDAFLFPSHEGAGMVVAEALSYGMPVICLDNYGPGQYVHPESKLRVKHGSYSNTVNMLAASLWSLFQNKELYKHESDLAVSQYSQYFTWDIKGNIFRNIYNEIKAETETAHAYTDLKIA